MVWGEVEFEKIQFNKWSNHPIIIKWGGGFESFTKDGQLYEDCDGECSLFPSKEQRDWSKFNPNKPKFDLMNENLNLAEILKDCPKGTKLYSPVLGEVDLVEIDIDNNLQSIKVKAKSGVFYLTPQGRLYYNLDQNECILFPSKEQRDWSKFKPKKPKFDPKTLQPFDKVLARDGQHYCWRCTFYSHAREECIWKYATTDSAYPYCIPYNDDTKHLRGTAEEAPEFYRYWEE